MTLSEELQSHAIHQHQETYRKYLGNVVETGGCTVLYAPRRSGKTTVLVQEAEHYMKTKHEKDNRESPQILFLSTMYSTFLMGDPNSDTYRQWKDWRNRLKECGVKGLCLKGTVDYFQCKLSLLDLLSRPTIVMVDEPEICLCPEAARLFMYHPNVKGFFCLGTGIGSVADPQGPILRRFQYVKELYEESWKQFLAEHPNQCFNAKSMKEWRAFVESKLRVKITMPSYNKMDELMEAREMISYFESGLSFEVLTQPSIEAVLTTTSDTTSSKRIKVT
ncbi:MAG: hypothetical protein ACTSUE_07735 [Promethearchaeota archaeon]